MTHDPHNNPRAEAPGIPGTPGTPETPAPHREDILMGRVVDGEATEPDWIELESLAGRDPGVWSRLADAQRAHASLQRTIDDALTVAELIDAPSPASPHDVEQPTVVLRLRAWGGWAAAAVIALAWIAGMNPGAHHGAPSPQRQTAGLPGANLGLVNYSPDELLQSYLQKGHEQGRVVAEMPTVMIESRPIDGGRTEIIFIRPLVEKAVVERLYEVGSNEWGEPVPVPVNWEEFAEGETL